MEVYEEEEGGGLAALLGDGASPVSEGSFELRRASPYYKKTHRIFRGTCRRFVEEHLIPRTEEFEKAKEVPIEIPRIMAEVGILPAILGPHGKGYDYALPGVLPPEDFDNFHELILFEELCRCGSGGIVWNLLGCLVWSLPPVVNAAKDNPELAKKVVGGCLQGRKRACLMITEPNAGSDVAGMSTTAVRVEEPNGDYHYKLEGQKKWISGGIFADYFTTAARTGGPGMGGISMFLLEKEMEGISTRYLPVQGMGPSGTSFVELDDVKCPRSNLLGEENGGFKMIVGNFNHERWAFSAMSTRFARVILEETTNFALRHSSFGEKLLEKPLVRWRLGEMARQTAALRHWLEALTFQVGMEKDHTTMAGPIALLKVQSSKTYEFIAREALSIFEGETYATGASEHGVVERLLRDVGAHAVPGGSEEIMIDLGVRQAMNKIPLLEKAAKAKTARL